MKHTVNILLLLALAGCDGNRPDSSETLPGNSHPGMAQFGQLVGDWKIEQQVLQQDGSWKPTEDAEWNFRFALGGHAIQDEWIQPPLSDPLNSGEKRQFGTNIRIYDSKRDQWRIVWTSSDQPTFTSYVASANDRGELIMIGDDPERPGVEQKITYFGISKDSWKWKLEFGKEPNSWVEVARIQATRSEPD